MNEFILDNGWVVKETESGNGILYVTPIANSIFQIYQEVEIHHDILLDIEKGERNIKDLFRKHKLHNLIFENGSKLVIGKNNSVNTPHTYTSNDFIATKENEGYFLEYERAAHGGGHRKIQITKEIYNDACSGKYNLPKLFEKYNLYHLDK